MSLRDVSRREFLGAAAFAAVGLPAIFRPAYSVLAAPQTTPYTPPESPRTTLNFNLDWKFLREDVPNADANSHCGTLDQAGQRYQQQISGHWIESIVFVLIPIPLLLSLGFFLVARRVFRWVQAGFH